MDASVVGIRLASGVVAPLVRKLFRQEGAGAGLVDRPHRISSYVAWREKRGLDAADLRKLADHLVREALGAPGEQPLPPGEEAGVSAALAATLHALGNLTLSDVDAVRLGPRAFARKLRAAAPHPGLSRDAELFHDRLVDLACLHILNFFTQRSTFVAATLVDQSRLHAETIAKVDELLTRVPRQDGRDTAFEARYLEYLARRHSTLTIFGLDLAPGSARWPLDAAYVSLEVSAAPGTGSAVGGGELTAPYSLPADRLLDEHHRVLLRGEAGSGKTTLIQWLAVTAAREHGDGLVPYVLPLRTLTRHGERLPAPRDFLAGTPLAGEAPAGWESRVLRGGRALLLVDGIDEIPEAERDRARDWLADLITAYPGNRWLVTSRPSAVRRDWLAAADFTEVALAPMGPDHVRAFIERWHAAADHAPAEYREQLLDSVARKPDLARLATNPLLCGLICALHRERRGFLPSGRKELYAAALSMLLDRRDRERGVRLRYLAEEPQLQLLQRLAYWLIRNGRTEMDRSRAEALIADALPAVPAVGALGDARAVFGHFLERTGLLRAPTVDTVQFVHRTFQDFLGARAALDEGSLGELTGHADDDQWEDVIRMAVAQGRPRERTEIIRGLLARQSNRSVLLAYASLQYATELDPALRAEAETAVRHLLPPKSVEEAEELGRTGPLVLELLVDPAEAGEDEALMAIAAAGETLSDLAIPYLAGFRDAPSAVVRHALVSLWGRFDRREYAREVIEHLRHNPNHLQLDDDSDADALHSFAHPPGLFVTDRVSGRALSGLFSRIQAASLGLFRLADLVSLDFLRGQTSLTALSIHRCARLEDVTALHGLPVRGAQLDVAAPGLHQAIASWPRLYTLELRSPHPWSARDLAPGADLKSLILDTPAVDVTGLGRHAGLLVLNLGHRWRPVGPADWAELSRLEKLEELAVPDEVSVLEGLARHARLPSLRSLRLYGEEVSPELEERLARRFPDAEIEPYSTVYEQ